MSRRVITEAYIKKSRKVQLANRIKDSASESLLGAVIAVVVFGSIWGLVEITLGGFLYFVHFPLYKGGQLPVASAWHSWQPLLPLTTGLPSSSG
jgi:hypothetical protein